MPTKLLGRKTRENEYKATKSAKEALKELCWALGIGDLDSFLPWQLC